MELTPLAVTAITNFILASEAFFFSGLFVARPKNRYSAAWFWQFALLTLATSALLGGIDHGFFESFGQITIRKVIEHTNWFLIGVLTLLVFITTVQQFFTPVWRKAGFIAAGIQFAVYTALILTVDNFLVVMLNYAPVMLLLLACNSLGLKKGTGAWAMSLGIVVSFAASGIQAVKIDQFAPIDHNGLYHIGMMAAMPFFYWGGSHLNGIIHPDQS